MEKYRETNMNRKVNSKNVPGQSKGHDQHFLSGQKTEIVLKRINLLKYIFSGKSLEWLICASSLYMPVKEYQVFFPITQV